MNLPRENEAKCINLAKNRQSIIQLVYLTKPIVLTAVIKSTTISALSHPNLTNFYPNYFQ